MEKPAKPLRSLPSKALLFPVGLAAAAAVLRLAFPPWSREAYGAIGLALFFWLFSMTRRPMLAGFFFHSLFGLFLSYYLFVSLTTYFHIGFLPSAAIFFVLAGVFPSILFTLCCRVVHGAVRDLAVRPDFWAGLGKAAWVAAAFSLAEFGRAALSPEQGFGHLALTWWKTPWMLSLAAVTGEAGLSFLLFFFSLLFFRAMSLAAKRSPIPAGASLAAGIAFLGLGALLSALAAPPADKGRPQAVALVHPALAQSQRWKSEFFRPHLEKYRAMSLSARFPDDAEARLIVWPETALTFFAADDPRTLEVIKEVCAAKGAWLLMGAPFRTGSAEERNTRNSVLLFTPEGELWDRYDKNYLLPLAEKRMGPWGLPSTGGPGSYHAGESARPLEISEGGRPFARLGVAVCFEVGIFRHMQSLWRKGSNVFANLSNDAWFADSSESEQQLALLSLACAGYGIPGIRATGYGVAALVDARGEVLARTGITEKTVLMGRIRVPEERPRPLAARLPNWFVLFCAAIFLAGAVPVLLQRGRDRKMPD